MRPFNREEEAPTIHKFWTSTRACSQFSTLSFISTTTTPDQSQSTTRTSRLNPPSKTRCNRKIRPTDRLSSSTKTSWTPADPPSTERQLIERSRCQQDAKCTWTQTRTSTIHSSSTLTSVTMAARRGNLISSTWLHRLKSWLIPQRISTRRSARCRIN